VPSGSVRCSGAFQRIMVTGWRKVRLRAIGWWLRALSLRSRIRAYFRYPELRELLSQFRNSKSTGVSTADSVVLYEQILARRPKVILELGPGTSTAVIALAILQVRVHDPYYAPRFIAVEEDERWLSYHRETIPPHLASSVELMASPIEVQEFRGMRLTKFAGIPALPYEFIHVDGPSFQQSPNRSTVLPPGCVGNKDLIDLAPMLSNRCFIIFDGRETTARITATELERLGFRVSRNPDTLSYQLERP